MLRDLSTKLACRIAALAMVLVFLLGPGISQVAAAERCRSRCEQSAGDAGACCGNHVAGDRSKDARSNSPAPQGCDPDAHCCPACGARPLFIRADGLSLAPEAAPIFQMAVTSATSDSFDEPFAIFHPPRA